MRSDPTSLGGAQISATTRRDGIDVEARWSSMTSGPQQLVITISPDASPQVVARGVNSGVMRRAESMLRELVAQVSEHQPQDDPTRLYWQGVAERVRSLPDTPRSRTGDYYRLLLDVYEFLEASQAQPVVELHRVMNECGRAVGRDTLNKQLQRARARRADRGGEK